MESIYLVITTFPTREEAIHMASRIIENHLGACVQIQESCTSIYEWKGVLETTAEFPVHIKTVESKKEALKIFIKQNHSYEIPEIVAIKLDDASDTYAQWITSQTCGAS
jgi:periplasmic divalent cation tolerance protein